MRTLTLAFALAAALIACKTGNVAPDGSRTGTMTTGALPTLQIDGADYRMAPGARIVGANNSSVTPNQVPPNSKVRYRVNASGQVTHVWVLPPDQ